MGEGEAGGRGAQITRTPAEPTPETESRNASASDLNNVCVDARTCFSLSVSEIHATFLTDRRFFRPSTQSAHQPYSCPRDCIRLCGRECCWGRRREGGDGGGGEGGLGLGHALQCRMDLREKSGTVNCLFSVVPWGLSLSSTLMILAVMYPDDCLYPDGWISSTLMILAVMYPDVCILTALFQVPWRFLLSCTPTTGCHVPLRLAVMYHDDFSCRVPLRLTVVYTLTTGCHIYLDDWLPCILTTDCHVP